MKVWIFKGEGSVGLDLHLIIWYKKIEKNVEHLFNVHKI